MCVIIYKPAGVAMPDPKIIEAAAKANPHGFGFVSDRFFYKGLSLNSFKRQLANVGEDENCIMHFRLATHGSIKKANCHPFNIDGVYFAHNGILDITPRGDKTDSETAFREVIYPAIAAYGLNSQEAEQAINSIIGYSKFAIMCEDNVNLYGNFILGDDGCYYSNLRFQSYLYW